MDLRHLRSFVAVAELLSFRRAAERLHLCQPPLSRQIKVLEENLGVRLLERGRTKQVTLTEAGQSYLLDVRRILAAVDTARERAREAQQGVRGTLKLANTPELSTPVVSPLLHAFRESFPQVKVSLIESVWPEPLEALDEGRIHAAICPFIGQPLDRRFRSRLLFSCPMVAVLPAGHTLAGQGRKALDVKRLTGQTLLTLSPKTRPGYAKMLDALCSAAGFTPTATHAVDKVENLLGMVGAGYGVAILPEMVAHAAHGSQIRPLCPPVPNFHLKLLWRREAASTLLDNFLATTRRAANGRDKGSRMKKA